MNNNENREVSSESSALRYHAEELLLTQGTPVPTENTVQRLYHELQIHEIELEMQNTELRSVRDELESSLDKYTMLYDFAPVGYCTLDREGIIQAANLTAATLFGKMRSQLIGRPFVLFIAEQPRQQLFSSFLDKIFANEGNESCELKLVQQGDSVFFVRIESRVCSSGMECSVAIIDVSARKRVEEEFQQNRRRLAWVLEKSHIGMWLYEISSGKLSWDTLTRKLCFIGYETEPTLDLFWSRIHPDDRETTRLTFENAIKSHTLYEIDHRLQNTVTGETRWLHSIGQASYAPDGEPLTFDGLIYDITTHKTIDDALQRSHEALEARVRERTAELSTSNLQLTLEIVERKKAEESLRNSYVEIKQLKEQLQAENVYLQQEVAQRDNFGDIIGESPALAHVFSQIEQVAPMNATVLLLGETGTGKGVVARAIHNGSRRNGRSLITVNCTALPATLVESELFGRERGAFTGSDTRQVGRFELADGGTLFLDEIGEMPLELQSKLLRVIQDGEFERLGSPRTIKVDVRIIAATNRDLVEEVKKGTFREDLFYRLNVFPILMPPLRERKGDIPLLVNHFVAKFNKKIGRHIESIAKSTLNALQEHHWPGNVRELESVIERSVITSQESALEVLDRFDTFRKPEEPASQDIKALVELEHDYILKTLIKTGWRIEGKNGAALLLGLNASTLRARMRKYGINRQ